jgi:hypothetical protein
VRVRLKQGIDHRSWLNAGSVYVVLAIEHYPGGSVGFRIASESNRQPMLFNASDFHVVDNTLPRSWRFLDVYNNIVVLGPEAFGQSGFWERCFDFEPEALEEYARAKSLILSES